MKFIYLTLVTLFLSLSCFANDEIFCTGGIKFQSSSIFVNLNEEGTSLGNGFYGSLNTENVIYDFFVEKLNEGYHFKAKIQNAHYFILDEVIQKIPSFRSIKLNIENEIFIQCRPYSVGDYCRSHTC